MVEIKRLQELLDEITTNPEGDYPKGLHCGVEDMGIVNCYEAADYGWEQAFEYINSFRNKNGSW